MASHERIRFDRVALENHADEYCKEELRLSRELMDTLRIAAAYAPLDSVSRVRRLLNDADRLTRYFSQMRDALIESGHLVEETSKAVLERLEDADEKIKILM